MVIQKGVDWGEPGALPDGAPMVRTNAELRRAIASGARTVGLGGGDLARTLGGVASGAMTFPIDLAHFRSGAIHELFACHLFCHKMVWGGRIIAVMNAQFRGRWDVSPRGHPNDGKLDVLDGHFTIADRWKAWRRLPLGTHVPHPSITQSQVALAEFSLTEAQSIWLDGQRIGSFDHFSVEIEPDALRVVL